MTRQETLQESFEWAMWADMTRESPFFGIDWASPDPGPTTVVEDALHAREVRGDGWARAQRHDREGADALALSLAADQGATRRLGVVVAERKRKREEGWRRMREYLKCPPGKMIYENGRFYLPPDIPEKLYQSLMYGDWDVSEPPKRPEPPPPPPPGVRSRRDWGI